MALPGQRWWGRTLAVGLIVACAGCYTQNLSDSATTSPAALTPITPANTLPAATPTTAISPVTALPTDAGTLLIHTVQRGETLFQIAQFYHVSVQALAAANAIADPSQIFVGQVLAIPPGDQPVSSAAPVVVVAANATSAPMSTNPLPQATFAPLALLPPGVDSLNGVPLALIIVMPEAVRLNVRQIFATGQALGRNSHAFSKLGDSIIEPPHFLARFDSGPYNLGEYAYLQPIIDYYAGSFARESVAVRRGLHTWSVLDPMFAGGVCQAGENMLACEIRLSNPSLLFIRLGTNDVGLPEAFERNLHQIVEYCLTNGVIPVLGTKADRFRDPNDTNNAIIRQTAAFYNVPLWDFDRIAQTLPGNGMDQDNVHLTTFYAHDYTSPVALQRGHGVNNLTALMILDAVLRAIQP